MNKKLGKINNNQNIYSQFRSNDPYLNFLMSQDGQMTLDKQIIKMMKDMDSQQIIQFSDQFFKFDNNKCDSLKTIISNQLTSRINFQDGYGANLTHQYKNSDIKQNHSKQKNNDNQASTQLRIIKEQNIQIFKRNQRNDEQQNDEQQNDEQFIQTNQIGAICQQVEQAKYQQIQQYKPQTQIDSYYLKQSTEQHIQYPNQATTIEQDYQSDQFQQISRQQLQNGKFRLTYNNGDVYQGQIENDMKNGWGQYFYSTGQKYSGFFQDDQIQGYGRYIFLSCAQYQGDWSSGMKHGLGILKFNNKDIYEGSFSNDVFHGKGIYKYANGDFFEGTWKQGLKNGKGHFQGRDGTIKIGNWINDKFQI